MKKYNAKEIELLEQAASPDPDQKKRYRDSALRTLFDIHKSKFPNANRGRDGLLYSTNANAELTAKNKDPRWTDYQNHDNPHYHPDGTPVAHVREG